MAVQKHTETITKGVRVEGTAVIIDFRWEGKRYRPTSIFKATQKGIKAAASLRRQVVAEIDSGIFSMAQFAEYFPSHKLSIKHIQEDTQEKVAPLTFKTLAEEAFKVHSTKVSPETIEGYRQTLNNWWMPYLAELPIASIDEDMLETLDADLEWPSIKTRNNCLIPLRFVFIKAMKKRIEVNGVKTPLLPLDPSLVLENGKPLKTKPDPFTPEERDLILSYFYRLGGLEIIWYHYFIVAFYTGMRTGELLALSWAQVDFNSKQLTVDRAYSRGRLKQTKTDEMRTFPVLPIVMNSLIAMKAYTSLQGEHVFPVPGDLSSPMIYTKPSARMFQKTIKKLGIRQRPTYNTRHTFATVMLMNGVRPGCASSVLGHSLAVFFSRYAAWIEGEATAEELAKIVVNDVSGTVKKLDQK